MSGDVLNSDLAQAGGWSTVFGSLILSVGEWLGEFTVNGFLQGIMLVGSIVFLYYKIMNARLDSKIKKRDLDDKPKEKHEE